jgi:hypothetical protein
MENQKISPLIINNEYRFLGTDCFNTKNKNSIFSGYILRINRQGMRMPLHYDSNPLP